MSGLPTAQLPSVSPGTAPIGPQPSTATQNALSSTPADTRSDATPPTPPAGAAAPATTGAVGATQPRLGAATPITVPNPPPVANLDSGAAPTTNQAGEVWVPGHYSWTSGQWSWVNGSWQRPPASGATWVPGRYEVTSKRWTEGHWQPAPR